MRTLFCEVLGHLNAVELPYVVAGAFALQHHTGIWRNTKDLDLFLTAEAVPEALKHLEEQGFEVEYAIRFGWPKRIVTVITSISSPA